MAGTQYNQPDDGIRAADVEAEAITWLDPENLGERVPVGMLTLVAGRPGQGKSLWTADLAARTTQHVGHVIFSNLEDPLAQVVRPRLEAAGADLTKVTFWNPILPRDTDALRAMIVALGTKLVIIDPVAAHLTVSIYNDQEVRQALSPLSKLANETGCAIVLISHTLKSARATSHPLECIGGSGGGLAGAARAVYIFGPDPTDSSIRGLAWAKMNIASPPPALLYEMDESEWVIGTGSTASVIKTGRLVLVNDHGSDSLEYAGKLAAGTSFTDKDDIPAEKKAIAAEWLTAYLMHGEQPAAQIREDAADDGITFATLRRAADEVGIQKARHGFGPGSYLAWSLPDNHPDLVANPADPTDPDQDPETTVDVTPTEYDADGNPVAWADGSTQPNIEDAIKELEAQFDAPEEEAPDTKS